MRKHGSWQREQYQYNYGPGNGIKNMIKMLFEKVDHSCKDHENKRYPNGFL